MAENLILAATFVAVLLVSTLSLRFLVSRREISTRLAEAGAEATVGGLFVDQDLTGLSRRDVYQRALELAKDAGDGAP